MKKSLVLSGGGTKGIYQTGVLRALHELGEDHFDQIIGVSVGALNAAMLVAHDEDRLNEMYDQLDASQVINGYVPTGLSLSNIINDRQEFMPALHNFIREHGCDVTPFYQLVDTWYNPEAFFASEIDFGCVTALRKDHSGVFVTKDMMKENGKDWLIASASAYPAFPIKNINGTEYVDGGYYDNFPIDYALRTGADEVTGIDMGEAPIHPLYIDKDHINYIHPHYPLYDFLCFDHEKMQKARVLGYHDAMKYYGKLSGERYTFRPFALPAYFDEYYRGLLILETKIKMATALSERFKSEHVITDRLCEQLHVTHLSTRQYLYGVLDALMGMLDLDDAKLWTIEEAKKEILAGFAAAAYEDYQYKPSLKPSEFREYFEGLDQKTIITIMIHSNFYPTHRILPENIALTVYPFETALADFVTIMMQHLI